MPDRALEIDQLTKRYGGQVALDGLSLTASAGSITGLLGPNGAGKTTTVECCEGYRRPDSGTVRVLGLDPVRQGRELRPRVGVMLQRGGVYAAVRVEEALRYMAGLYAHPLAPSALIERLDLGKVRRTAFRNLSGGEQQRLGLALALVGRPELAFLDEPTAGLDPVARRSTWALLEDLRRDGVTVILTTHLLDEAERLCDCVYIVNRGRVVASGTPGELKAKGGRSSLRFNGPAGMDLSDLRVRLPSGVEATESSPGAYLVEGSVVPEVVATVTGWCASRGVMPDGLSVGPRSLEEVFLELVSADSRE